jgi:hypothetical protein
VKQATTGFESMTHVGGRELGEYRARTGQDVVDAKGQTCSPGGVDDLLVSEVSAASVDQHQLNWSLDVLKTDRILSTSR